MNIAVLGTGVVGRAHAAKLSALGHNIVVGTRDVKRTLGTRKPDARGLSPFSAWLKGRERVRLATFPEAATEGEIVIEAIAGSAAAGLVSGLKEELSGKVLVDIANPLDDSHGMPPPLFVSNTDSLGERIQASLPGTSVVKAFNTMNADLQVDARRLAAGDHTLFVCGNDGAAKAKVLDLARSYGWKLILDLGDITGSRAAEMLLPAWIRLWGMFQSPDFNFKIVLP